MFPAFCFAKRTLERAGTLGKDALTVGMILSIIFILNYLYRAPAYTHAIQKSLSVFAHAKIC